MKRNIKSLTVKQACQLGFKVFNWGCLGLFLPVKLPLKVATQDCIYNSLLSQFSPTFEDVKAEYSEKPEGHFHQMIQCHDAKGASGNKYDIFIVFGYYSENCGIEFWEAYGAIEINKH